jgi:Asp/Glu/hydantoin racemase
MKTIALIHTTPVTIDLLKTLAAELLPGVNVINLMDDSILPQLLANGGNLAEVEERWLNYATGAWQAGAQVIMSACSSVGELAEKAAGMLPVPVLRIDEAMAEEAVHRAARVGVAATLPTTLNPTVQLVERKAAISGRGVKVQAALAGVAYQRLLSGDRSGHDELLAKTLRALGQEVEIIILAQASMARVLPALEPELQARCLTSPRSGMLRLRQVLESLHE